MWIRNLLLGTFFLGMAAATGGCSAGDCGTFAEAACAKISECQPYFSGLIATSTTTSCVALERDLCQRSLSAPGTNNTPEQAGRCGDVYKKSACDDLFSGALSSAADCQPAGSRLTGDPCAQDSQCQSAHCQIAGGNCGTCQPTASAGQACGGTGKIACASSLSCVNSVCVSYGSVGHACSASAPCQNNLRCVSNTCQPKVDPGGPCTTSNDCKTYLGNQVCDTTTKLCTTVAINYIDGGGSCSNTVKNNMLNVCKADFDCVAPATGGATTCIPRTALGQPCGAAGQASCALGSSCISNTCQIVDPASCG